VADRVAPAKSNESVSQLFIEAGKAPARNPEQDERRILAEVALNPA